MPAPNLGTLSQPLPGATPGGGPDPSQDPLQAQVTPQAQPATPAPATGNESAAGDESLAHAHIGIALSLLNSTLGKLKPGSEAHKVVMEVTRRLSKQFAGSPGSSLSGSEASMLQSTAQQQGAAPLSA